MRGAKEGGGNNAALETVEEQPEREALVRYQAAGQDIQARAAQIEKITNQEEYDVVSGIITAAMGMIDDWTNEQQPFVDDTKALYDKERERRDRILKPLEALVKRCKEQRIAWNDAQKEKERLIRAAILKDEADARARQLQADIDAAKSQGAKPAEIKAIKREAAAAPLPEPVVATYTKAPGQSFPQVPDYEEVDVLQFFCALADEIMGRPIQDHYDVVNHKPQYLAFARYDAVAIRREAVNKRELFNIRGFRFRLKTTDSQR